MDIELVKKKSKQRFLFHMVSIVSLIVLVITSDVLLLLFSSLDYGLNVAINIILTILLVTFLIFYFLNVFPIVFHYYSYYKYMNKTNLEHRRNMTFLKEAGSKDIENVTYTVLQFLYKEGERVYNDNLYLLDCSYPFKEGKNYQLETYHNVIVMAKEI